MNRRGFFHGLLAGAMTVAAHVYTPSALDVPRLSAVTAATADDFLALSGGNELVANMLANQANYMRGCVRAPVNPIHPFETLR